MFYSVLQHIRQWFFFSPLPTLEVQFGLWSTNPEQVYQTNKKREREESPYIHFNALYLIIFNFFLMDIIIKITEPIIKRIHVLKTKILLYNDIMSLLRVQNPVDSKLATHLFFNKNTIAPINY